jgi:electron transport complex protein RnfB
LDSRGSYNEKGKIHMLNDIMWPVIALGALGLILGLGLAIAAKVFAVKVDPKVEEVRQLLPGANCGGCGFPGCDGFAKALAAGEATPSACVVVSADNLKAIAGVLGVDAGAGAKKVARVLCRGDATNVTPKYNYNGIPDCRAAAALAGGPSACRYGCLGQLTCASACPFGAIHRSENGIAEIDENICTGCGNCVAICPKSSIALVPKDQAVYVRCHAPEKGKAVSVNCKAGCIACGLCVKKCPEQAITMVDNIPVIDYDKCTHCGTCAAACPKGVIAGKPVEKAEAVNG